MDEYKLYLSGDSIPEVSEMTGIAKSTLRFRFKKAGILRSTVDGIRNAAKKGKLGSGLRGKTRSFSDKHKENIKKARQVWGEENAHGCSEKPSGYLEFTRGEEKGRRVHVVVMENRIGRKLLVDECVHHIDGNRSNNSEDNLALVTKSGHTRLHRFEDKISGKTRERNKNGTWS